MLVIEQVEHLRANDESPVEFLMHDDAEAKKYVSTLVKVMKTTTSDARAQHFAVSRYGHEREPGGGRGGHAHKCTKMDVCVGGQPPVG